MVTTQKRIINKIFLYIRLQEDQEVSSDLWRGTSVHLEKEVENGINYKSL